MSRTKAIATLEEVAPVEAEAEQKEATPKEKTYKVRVLYEQKFYHGDRWFYFKPGETYTVNVHVRERLKLAGNIDI